MLGELCRQLRTVSSYAAHTPVASSSGVNRLLVYLSVRYERSLRASPTLRSQQPQANVSFLNS
jgi:hypothetical protein